MIIHLTLIDYLWHTHVFSFDVESSHHRFMHACNHLNHLHSLWFSLYTLFYVHIFLCDCLFFCFSDCFSFFIWFFYSSLYSSISCWGFWGFLWNGKNTSSFYFHRFPFSAHNLCMRVFVCVHDKQFIYKEIIFSSVNPLKLNFTKRNEHSRRFIAVASFLFLLSLSPPGMWHYNLETSFQISQLSLI